MEVARALEAYEATVCWLLGFVRTGLPLSLVTNSEALPCFRLAATSRLLRKHVIDEVIFAISQEARKTGGVISGLRVGR